MIYDITFCSDESCQRTDCERHPTRTPKGVPYSIADLSSHDDYYCAYYWPDMADYVSPGKTVTVKKYKA